MSEYSGLTVTINNSDYKNIKGIILDTNSVSLEIAIIERRAVKDMETNTYHTIQTYSTVWAFWGEVVIDFPNIEVYKIAITQDDNRFEFKECRYVEGEVYSFSKDGLNCRLGISKTIDEKSYVVTDLMTGGALATDSHIESLRCQLPRIAKRVLTNLMQKDYYKEVVRKVSMLPVVNSFHTISLYKTNDYPF